MRTDGVCGRRIHIDESRLYFCTKVRTIFSLRYLRLMHLLYSLPGLIILRL
jgi:hypothetical protein